MAKRHKALVAPSDSTVPAALQGRVFAGACDGEWVFEKNGKTRTSRWTSKSFFYAGSGLELRHMEKGKIELS